MFCSLFFDFFNIHFSITMNFIPLRILISKITNVIEIFG